MRGGVGLALIGIVAACSSPPPEPRAMTPVFPVALETPVTLDTIAVLDFEDRRPEWQSSPETIAESFDDSRVAPDNRFWNFRASAEVNSTGIDQPFLRVTGNGAFRWYPFPYSGTGGARGAPPSRGVADFVALSLERRGLSSRVVRAANLEEARRQGATFVLRGVLQEFVGLFSEVHDPQVPRPDDWRDSRVWSRVGVDLSLLQLPGENVAWSRAFPVVEGETPPYLFDELSRFRGTGFYKALHLDQESQPEMAFSDLVTHLQIHLEAVTVATLNDLEDSLRGSRRLD